MADDINKLNRPLLSKNFAMSAIPVILIFMCIPCIAKVSEPTTFDSGVCSFNLYSYKMTGPVENAIVFGVSRILATYKDLFGFPYPDDFKVNVTIIGGKDEFLEYQNENIGKVISQTGYYSGRDLETVAWSNTDTKSMLAVLFHEASHMILGYQVPWIPNWLSEGLSEYFEGLNVVGEKKRVNLQQARHSWCKLWLRTGFPIPVGVYINLTHNQWKELFEKDPNAAYTIGYSLTYFMMSSNRTQEVLKQLLWQYKMFGPQAKSVQIINLNYPGGFEKFEKHWQTWITKARSYRPLRALKKTTKQPVADQSAQ